jgi:hypothetical protein
MKDTGNINVNNMATNTEKPINQNNSELATDIACIKLDQVINERHIFDNTSHIKEIGNMLAKFEKQNEEMQQEIHNLKEVSEPLRKHVQQTTGFQYANNPAQQQPQRRLSSLSENKSIQGRSVGIQHDQEHIKRQPRHGYTQKHPRWMRKSQQDCNFRDKTHYKHRLYQP